MGAGCGGSNGVAWARGVSGPDAGCGRLRGADGASPMALCVGGRRVRPRRGLRGPRGNRARGGNDLGRSAVRRIHRPRTGTYSSQPRRATSRLSFCARPKRLSSARKPPSFSSAVIGRRFLVGLASDAVSATGVAAAALRREEERRGRGSPRRLPGSETRCLAERSCVNPRSLRRSPMQSPLHPASRPARRGFRSAFLPGLRRPREARFRSPGTRHASPPIGLCTHGRRACRDAPSRRSRPGRDPRS